MFVSNKLPIMPFFDNDFANLGKHTIHCLKCVTLDQIFVPCVQNLQIFVKQKSHSREYRRQTFLLSVRFLTSKTLEDIRHFISVWQG